MLKLLTPAKIGTVSLKNRVLIPSMCLYFSDQEGNVTDKLYTFIEKRAKAEVGGFIVPANPHGANKPNRASIADDSRISQWQRLTNMVHSYDARIFCQLHPAGIQYGRVEYTENPLDNTTKAVEELIESYAIGALRAKKAGFDGVEIHGAHGHEIALFLSNLLNQRTDKYGGDLTGHARIVTEMIEKIKRYAGKDFPVILRISGEERLPGGREIEETLELCRLVDASGVDAIHVSAGMPESEEWECPSSNVLQGHLGWMAEALRKGLNIPIITVGRIVDWKVAERIVASGQADFVAVARAFLAEPNWMDSVGTRTDQDGVLRQCIGCNQGCRTKRGREKSPTTCLQNPSLGREELIELKRNGNHQKVCIIGAGVSGLEAANILSQRGFEVTVFEKEKQLGGNFRWASVPPGKQEYLNLLRYYEVTLKARDVKILYGQKVEYPPEGFDIYLLAVGGQENIPEFARESKFVNKAVELLSDGCSDAEHFVVVGNGLVGYETADYLIHKGKRVILVGDSLEEPLTRFGIARWHFMKERFEQGDIQIIRDSRITAIDDKGFVILHKNGEISKVKGQYQYVLACGYKPDKELFNKFKKVKQETFLIGSANGCGDALESIRDAFDTAYNI